MRRSGLSAAVGLATIAAAGLVSVGAASATTPPGSRAGSAAVVAAPLQGALAGAVTVTFDGRCSNYGLDVANTTAIPQSVILTVGGTAQAPVVVAAGATVHIPLSTSTQPATTVVLTDTDGGILFQTVVRFCAAIFNISATINAAPATP